MKFTGASPHPASPAAKSSLKADGESLLRPKLSYRHLSDGAAERTDTRDKLNSLAPSGCESFTSEFSSFVFVAASLCFRLPRQYGALATMFVSWRTINRRHPDAPVSR